MPRRPLILPGLICVGLCTLSMPGAALACDEHWAAGIEEPTGVWPTQSTVSDHSLASASAAQAAAQLSAIDASSDASISSWMRNTTGQKGHSPSSAINALVSQINANVQTVAYNATDVYIHATGVPSHDVGPFTGNPAAPSDRNRTVHIPRTPVVNNGTKTSVGLGPIGVMLNGVAFFDPRDAQTYNNQNVWHQNANKFEAASFDTGPGHPAPDNASTSTPKTGNYHYHQAPVALLNELDPGNTGQHASPLLGFAFDGFPIYGPYGYTNTDGTGGISLMSSSYQPRSITQRTTLPSGAAASFAGPDVSATYPIGSYIEDYVYTAGTGTLDQYNGRFAVTPDYPLGTFAYYVTLNNAGSAVYPYIIGPQYYGVVSTDNLGAGSITVPGDVAYYTGVPEPTSLGAIGLAGLMLTRRRTSTRSKTG
jgi:hypothetical protein